MIPEFLEEKLINQYGLELTNQIIEGYKKERNTSIRINNLKTTKEDVLIILKENNINYQEINWYENSLLLDVKEDIVKTLDIYNEGKIYLQSLSSQLPPLFLEPKENEQILDMTAAPGGKTTEIAALTNNGALITAVEKNKIRSDRLKYNIEKQGAKKVSVLNVDSRKLDEFFMFDKILLDAPCSGSGTLSKETINDFNEDLLTRSIKFQKELIEEAIKHLKVNGELIYSTCSILKEENEEILNYILKKNNNIEIIPLDLTKFNELPLLPSNINGTLCVTPTKEYEGFFVSKLKRIK